MMPGTGERPIPGFFVPHIAMYVADAGGDVRSLYRAAGLDPASFDPEAGRVDEDQLHALLVEASRQGDEPALGFVLGSRFSISSFGLLSRALMSCATLREVARLLERYSVLVLPLVRFSLRERGAQTLVEVKLLSRHPLLNQAIFEAILACWQKLVFVFVGRAVPIERIVCSFDAPDYLARYEALGAAGLEFGADGNCVVVRREFADLPLATANAVDARATREACERELTRSLRARTLSEQVSDQIRDCLDTGPSGADIAARLNLSERTLRRRLSGEGNNYRRLLRDVREELAVHYLEQSRLQVEAIALRLGYRETSNFRAAFRRWTGVSPRAWRQGRRTDTALPPEERQARDRH